MTKGQKPSTLGVAIVSYESDDQIGPCLAAIRSALPSSPIQIVDNASQIPPTIPSDDGDTSLYMSATNLGYGKAINAAVARLRSAHRVNRVLVVNPDTRLSSRTAKTLDSWMESHPNCAVAVGSLVDAEGRPVPSAWGKPTVSRAIWHAFQLERLALSHMARVGLGNLIRSTASMGNVPSLVEGHVLGGAMMIDAESFERVGGFSSNYFLYWEDADLCQRLRADGMEVWFVPSQPSVHIGGASSKGSSSLFRSHWYAASAKIYMETHHPATKAKLLSSIYMTGIRFQEVERFFKGGALYESETHDI